MSEGASGDRPVHPSSAPASAAFETRAARALLLARERAADSRTLARDTLRFVADLHRAGGLACQELASRSALRPLTGRLEQDVDTVLALRPLVFDLRGDTAPGDLLEEARERAGEPRDVATARLAVAWSGEPEARGDYLSRALLRPYVASLASLGLAPDRLHRAGHCPFCGGAPIVSSRRTLPETHGAQRFLGCALCLGEWPFNRIRCPACLEDDPEKLPAFQGEGHPLVRIEACETCHRYVKSLDMTLDGRPVPEVDDLLSIALDLWAGEKGYTRIEPGLAGI